MTATPTPDDGAALLKPCPFCGGEAEIQEEQYGLQIVCKSAFWKSWGDPERCKVAPTISYSANDGRLERVRHLAIAAWNTRSPAPVSGEGVLLKWTPQSLSNKECPYNHTTAPTPFGRFLLTWKGWKDDPGYGFDETPWGEVEYRGWNSVEEAQKWAEEEMMRRICQHCAGAEAKNLTLPENASTDTPLLHGASHPETQ